MQNNQIDPTTDNLRISWAKKCIETGIDLNKVYYDESFLHIAVRENNLDLVNFLMEKNANVNQANNNEDTPLQLAIKKGHLTVILALLNHKEIDINLANINGDTPLHLALKYITKFIHPNFNMILDLVSPHYLQQYHQCYYKIIKILIDNHADVNKTNSKGQISLHLAADDDLKLQNSRNEHITIENSKIINLLLKKTNNLNLADKNGNTPLHLATLKANLKVIETLLKNKANINLTNNEGDTALRLAIKLGNLETFLLLIQHDHNISKNEYYHNSLLDLALTDNTKFNLGIIGILINSNDFLNIHGVLKNNDIFYIIHKFKKHPALIQEIIINLLPAMNNLENAFFISDLFTKEHFKVVYNKNNDFDPTKLHIEKLLFFLNKYQNCYDLEDLKVEYENYRTIVQIFLTQQLKEIFTNLILNYPEKTSFIVEGFTIILKNFDKSNLIQLSQWLIHIDDYINYNERIINKLAEYVTPNNGQKPAAIITSFLDLNTRSQFQKSLLLENKNLKVSSNYDLKLQL